MTCEVRRAIAVYWSPYLILALMHGSDVLAIENPRCRRGGPDRERLEALFAEFVARHGPEELVVEARTARILDLEPAGQITVLNLRAVKTILLGSAAANHRRLYEEILRLTPESSRFVRCHPRTGTPDLSGYWPTARLLPVALGLAASRLTSGRPL